MLALCHYGHDVPIFVYSFEKGNADVNMEMKTSTKQNKKIYTEPIKLKTNSTRTIEVNGSDKQLRLQQILDKIDVLLE